MGDDIAINELFAVHRLNDMGMGKAKQIAGEFSALLVALEGLCDAKGRDFAIVRTKLQEAAFFAKRAMATDAANQEADNGR